MKYGDAFKALLGEQEFEELSKELLPMVTKPNASRLLRVYLTRMDKELNSGGYPDLSSLRKRGEQEIYCLLLKEKPLSTDKILDELGDALPSSLRYRTHLSAKLQDMVSLGFVGTTPRSGYTVLYTTSEKAVQLATEKLGLKKENLSPQDIWTISDDTRLAPIYVLRVLENRKANLDER